MPLKRQRHANGRSRLCCHRRLTVLPLSVGDNSDFSANHLTALETLLMLASQGAYQAPHFKQ
jgi:hypothetical protein